MIFMIQGCSNIKYVDTNKELFNHVKIEEFKPTEAKTISDINKNYLELYKCYIKNKNILETLKSNGCK